MKRLVLIILILSLSVAQANIRAGDRAFNAGDYEKAAAEYSASLENNPQSVRAAYKLAKALTFQAATMTGAEAEAVYEEAVGYARLAVELDENETEAYFELARALGRLAQFRGVLQSLNIAGEVKSSLERSIELDPDNDSAIHALALWNLEVPWIAGGRSGQTKPLFEQAIAIDPQSIIHRLDYGSALLALGEKEAAKEQLMLALSLEAKTAADRSDQVKAQQLLDTEF